MPIEEITFSDGICSLKEVGRITAEDAQNFTQAVATHAAQSPQQIVVVIDATQAKLITPQASLLFAKSSSTANVIGYIVIVQNVFMEGTSRLLGERNENQSTHVFTDSNKAMAFAAELVERAQQANSGE